LNHDWFAGQLQRAEFLWKCSHEGPLFRLFPLLLQSIISNQMRPRRLRGAWFSRLLRRPARRRSGSILSPGTHTRLRTGHTTIDVLVHPGSTCDVGILLSLVVLLCHSTHLCCGLCYGLGTMGCPFVVAVASFTSVSLDPSTSTASSVGWVIRPVKIVPEMTYTVSSGTLNLCSLTHSLCR